MGTISKTLKAFAACCSDKNLLHCFIPSLSSDQNGQNALLSENSMMRKCRLFPGVSGLGFVVLAQALVFFVSQPAFAKSKAKPSQPLSTNADEVKLSTEEVSHVEFILHHKGEAYWKETYEALNAAERKALNLVQRAESQVTLGQFDKGLSLYQEAAKPLAEDPDIHDRIARLNTVVPHLPRVDLPGKAGDLMRQGVTLYVLNGDAPAAAHRVAYSISIDPIPVHKEFLNAFCSATGQKIDVDWNSPLDAVEQKLSAALLTFRKGQYLETIELCKDAILMDPSNALAYKRMGSAFYALGDFSKARDAWSKSLDLNPDDPKKEEVIKFIELAKKRDQENGKIR